MVSSNDLDERLVHLAGLLDRSANTARLALRRLEDLEKFVDCVALSHVGNFETLKNMALDLQGRTYGPDDTKIGAQGNRESGGHLPVGAEEHSAGVS